MSLHFYNSLHRRVEAFTPITPGQVALYTCGPTVYDFAHVGNFRAYMFEDLLRRSLTYAGYAVTQVMNLTDVDDKTIKGSQRAGLPLAEFTRKYKDAFFEDLEALRIQPAEHYPAATEHIQEMIDLIRALMDKGIAYQAEDGSVYFAIARFPGYGQLVTIDPEAQRRSSRTQQDEYDKESVADFALWKAHSEADGEVSWESPWGRGRPGWHVECSAMSMKYLGKTFDIHTGGIDNMFPHHEDEIAQSEAANGCTFVNYWLHCAHLIVDGEKMSKSLGNFYTLRQILDQGYSGREVRWVLLGTHYRQALNFSFQACLDARASLQRIDDLVARLKGAGTGTTATGLRESIQTRLDEFLAGLADDLNISAALAGLFGLVRDVNKGLDAGPVSPDDTEAVLDALRKMDQVLDVIHVDRAETVPANIVALAEERQQARKDRHFALADQLRDTLRDQGWVVEDTPTGPRIKRF